MDQPSQLIADRYHVGLSASWQRWFDFDSFHVPLAGAFRQATQHHCLLDRAPAIVWPGLMLPDTLPILGNEYGDWICVRVDEQNRLGELIHWYHGGGDWIPVGRTIAEAALHDAVDQLRPRSGQVLRGAVESTEPDHVNEVIQRLQAVPLQSWFTDSLGHSSFDDKWLRAVMAAMVQNDYSAALKTMEESNWCTEATYCDRIEFALQQPIRSLSEAEIWKRLGMNYEPDFVRWLFDVEQIPYNALHQIQEIFHSLGHPPLQPQMQDWRAAEALALRVLARRNDLAWAVDIAGWAAQRRGDFASACRIYFNGRFASAFSNQSVRLRSHGFDSYFGKVALAELWKLREHLTTEQRDDSYVQQIWQTPSRMLQREVQNYWTTAGNQAMRDGHYAAAYGNYYRAGWDLGAQRMTDYVEILSRLVESADAAGWKSRAAVAATHLTCLAKLAPPRAGEF